MIWTYRVFCNREGRYSVREVFYERDRTLIDYSKNPVALEGNSPEELLQLVQWFKEAFELPVLSLEETEVRVAAQKQSQLPEKAKKMSLQEVIAELAADRDSDSESVETNPRLS